MKHSVIKAGVVIASLAVLVVFGVVAVNHMNSPEKAKAARLVYPMHTNIVATTFWVGEIFNATAADGSQVCSTYQSRWAVDWSGGIALGNSNDNSDCAGSPFGGCDGIALGDIAHFKCKTEKRTISHVDRSLDYFPVGPTGYLGSKPSENPFYLDLPFDDVNNATAFKERCQVIPWAAGSSQCKNKNYSFMKNHWVEIHKGSAICYGQIEDAGPGAYKDAAYVFGSNDARPVNRKYNRAGMDVSPALNGCLNFKELDGDTDRVSWKFIDRADVPYGPWLTVETKGQVS